MKESRKCQVCGDMFFRAKEKDGFWKRKYACSMNCMKKYHNEQQRLRRLKQVESRTKEIDYKDPMTYWLCKYKPLIVIQSTFVEG